MTKHIGSVFTNEQELLKAILKIHVNAPTFDYDPMFFKGNFYKEIPKPKFIYDINPVMDGCKKQDARVTAFENMYFKSMILDPPFMFGIHGQSDKYYASQTHGIYKDFAELEEAYKAFFWEAHRILDRKGILVFKCQDYTDSITTITHAHVWQWAIEAEFYPKDLAILHLPKNKVANHKLTQRHLRKHHSYFWVFER